MTKISVIIPIYNVEKYIEECLNSVLGQTFYDIEIICINDGSTDKSADILDRFANNDTRIKAIHQENSGYGSAVNNGIRQASGEYLAIVEPDDFIEKDMYEKLYKQADRFQSDICKCGFYQYNSSKALNLQNKKWIHDNQDISTFPADKTFTLKEYPIMLCFHASVWSCLYRTEFLKNNQIRFNETKGASYQDFPFMVETMSKAQKISVVQDYLYHWRVEPNQNSSSKSKDQKLMIMLKQCEKCKNILKEQNIYESTKEEILSHFCSVNFGFYKKINYKFKKQYFDNLKNLFSDLKDDKSFTYKYFNKKEKEFVQNILNNNYLSTLKPKDIVISIIHSAMKLLGRFDAQQA